MFTGIGSKTKVITAIIYLFIVFFSLPVLPPAHQQPAKNEPAHSQSNKSFSTHYSTCPPKSVVTWLSFKCILLLVLQIGFLEVDLCEKFKFINLFFHFWFLQGTSRWHYMKRARKRIWSFGICDAPQA